MVCRHCGKVFPDDAKYCPYCAEPVPVMQTEEQNLKQYKGDVLFSIIVYIFKCLGCCAILFLFLALFGGLVLAIIATTIIFVVFATIGIFIYREKTTPGRTRTINMQFNKDQTSICPKCGSHNIKVYRKGYDYRPGFWGSMFGVREAGYVGGFDANKACCRCKNCGNDWETDYDYRLIH